MEDGDSEDLGYFWCMWSLFQSTTVFELPQGRLELQCRDLVASKNGQCVQWSSNREPLDSGEQALQCLINSAISLGELSSLIESIFSSEKTTNMVGCLQGSGTQTFVNVVDEVRYCSFIPGESSDWLHLNLLHPDRRCHVWRDMGSEMGRTWGEKREREEWLRGSHQKKTHLESACFNRWKIMFYNPEHGVSGVGRSCFRSQAMFAQETVQWNTAIHIKLVKHDSVWVMHSLIWCKYIRVARSLMQKRVPIKAPVQLDSKPPSSGVCDLKVSTLPGCWLCVLLRGIQYSKVLLRYQSTSDYLCKVRVHS